MLVKIKSKTVDSESSGKTLWVLHWPEDSLKLHVPFKGGIGSCPWAVTISGTNVRDHGTGQRGGDRKEVESQLMIELSPTDIASIVNFAIMNGLVQVSPVTTLNSKVNNFKWE